MVIDEFLLKVLVLGIIILGPCYSHAAEADYSITKPGCRSSCGNLSIPYPFGSSDGNSGCHFNFSSFNVHCNYSTNPPTPYMGNLQISNISLQNHEIRVSLWVSQACYDSSGYNEYLSHGQTLSLAKFPISTTKNKFTVVGCDTQAFFKDGDGKFTFGCVSFCNNITNVNNGSCSGIGCCETSIPTDSLNYEISFQSFYNHKYVLDFNPCSYAFVAEIGSYNFSVADLNQLKSLRSTVVLDWAIGEQTCKDAKQDPASYLCAQKSYCTDAKNGVGYKCTCLEGYQGNPYLENGCHGVSISFLLILLGVSWLYLGLKERKISRQREKFFQENGGRLMLQKLLSEHEGSIESARIFTDEELKKATDHYHESRILGQGGQGTVYRGILSDNTVVAIKKAKILDRSQVEEFINELIILSQINHRNVVKLIGCCFETEVPLLVYEFVNHGTLADHIHKCGHESTLCWRARLRIAGETAGALSYLHSDASDQILHRDIKSTNILLDENYMAKVADFGASRLVPLDRTQLTTLVQGTLGYLDPEYFHSIQLTEKSDVYSFGVVLAELLTGLRALSFERAEKERNLSLYFASAIKGERLFEIIDLRVLNEGNPEEIKEVAMLANRCLRVKGEDRPTMKEVAMELEGLMRVMDRHPWVNQSCDLEEAEHFLGKRSSKCDGILKSNAPGNDDSISNQVPFEIESGR
ncbi:putative wall-associated receptor kinase-like 16 [Eucalyptus grandis]|uniref:putative wall-associated receptor kinase-like 16 n=1 Tax=Eucalyptus grandis TaxID=71139 RepID=UPI00192EC63E|nr:putative wall-associated receptor kinase-like 16 [Eucalyptus grandis]